MTYFGIMPERKLWVKAAVVLFGIYVVYHAVVNGTWLYLPFGIIMILATFSKRQHLISEKGADILYTVCGAEFHNLWTWEEINTIHTDSIKLRPNVAIHIGKDVVNRRFIFSEDNTDKILQLAKKMNPDIFIAEIDHR